jgi:hypothetical protein
LKVSSKELVRYVIILLLTGVIFWYLFRQINLTDFKLALQEFNFWWIGLSILLSVVSHFLRAWRWKGMLDSTEHPTSLINSYFAVMIGYLANSVFPRLGEVTRCGVLHRTDRVPVSTALGTVVTERVIDLFMLLILTLFTFLFQYNLLENYFHEGLNSLKLSLTANWWILALLCLGGISSLYILFYSRWGEKLALMIKVKAFIKGLWEGILSLKHLKNPLNFWLATIGIWVLYFLMLYVITFGSPLTKELGILAGLSILVMGSFGMASPAPNGIGAFHSFVAGVLVLYGIEQKDGIIFATIMHTSQLLTVLVVGSASLILVNVRSKKHQAK